VLTDKYGPVEFLARRAVASGEPSRVAYGQRQLDNIERIRARRRGATS